MTNIKEIYAKYQKSIENFIGQNDIDHAANDLRILMELIVDTYGPQEQFYLEKTLFEKIEFLNENKIVPLETISIFHNIRKNTNDSHHVGTTTISAESIKYYLKELGNLCEENRTVLKILRKRDNVVYCRYDNINTYLNNADIAVLNNNSNAVGSNMILAIEELCDICFSTFNFNQPLSFDEKISYFTNNDIINVDQEYLLKNIINDAYKAIRSHGEMDISIIKTSLLTLENSISDFVNSVESFISRLDGNTTIYKSKYDKEKRNVAGEKLYRSLLETASNIATVIGFIVAIFLTLGFIDRIGFKLGPYILFLFLGITFTVYPLITIPVLKIHLSFCRLNGSVKMTWDELLYEAGKTKSNATPIWFKVFLPILGSISIIVGIIMALFS